MQEKKRDKLTINNGIVVLEDVNIVKLTKDEQKQKLREQSRHFIDNKGVRVLLAPQGLSVTNKLFINN